jgi:hypothetical protein
MLTLILILLVAVYFSQKRKNAITEDEKRACSRLVVFMWVFLILILFHGC